MSCLPDIIVTLDDNRKLTALVQEALHQGNYSAASRLAEELSRARLVPAEEVPHDCLTLNASGVYVDERSKAVREVTLVASRQQRSTFGLMSVLSEVGTALLGLSQGQCISWRDASGGTRAVRLLEVRFQPERQAWLAGRAQEGHA